MRKHILSNAKTGLRARLVDAISFLDSTQPDAAGIWRRTLEAPWGKGGLTTAPAPVSRQRLGVDDARPGFGLHLDLLARPGFGLHLDLLARAMRTPPSVPALEAPGGAP